MKTKVKSILYICIAAIIMSICALLMIACESKDPASEDTVTVTEVSVTGSGKVGDEHTLSYTATKDSVITVIVKKGDAAAVAADYTYTEATKKLVFNVAATFTVTVKAELGGKSAEKSTTITITEKQVVPEVPEVTAVTVTPKGVTHGYPGAEYTVAYTVTPAETAVTVSVKKGNEAAEVNTDYTYDEATGTLVFLTTGTFTVTATPATGTAKTSEAIVIAEHTIISVELGSLTAIVNQGVTLTVNLYPENEPYVLSVLDADNSDEGVGSGDYTYSAATQKVTFKKTGHFKVKVALANHSEVLKVVGPVTVNAAGVPSFTLGADKTTVARLGNVTISGHDNIVYPDGSTDAGATKTWKVEYKGADDTDYAVADTAKYTFVDADAATLTFTGKVAGSFRITYTVKCEHEHEGEDSLVITVTPIQYSVSYSQGEGVTDATGMPADGDVVEDTVLDFATEPARTGYTFKGWKISGSDTVYKKDGEGNTTSYDVTATVAFVAQWEAEVYNITYNGCTGANNPNASVTTYTIETATLTLQPATKDGAVFIGWFTQEEGGDEITELPHGSTGHKVIYAHWHTHSFDANHYCETDNVFDTSAMTNAVTVTLKNSGGWGKPDVTTNEPVILGKGDCSGYIAYTATGGGYAFVVDVGSQSYRARFDANRNDKESGNARFDHWEDWKNSSKLTITEIGTQPTDWKCKHIGYAYRNSSTLTVVLAYEVDGAIVYARIFTLTDVSTDDTIKLYLTGDAGNRENLAAYSSHAHTYDGTTDRCACDLLNPNHGDTENNGLAHDYDATTHICSICGKLEVHEHTYANNICTSCGGLNLAAAPNMITLTVGNGAWDKPGTVTVEPVIVGCGNGVGYITYTTTLAGGNSKGTAFVVNIGSRSLRTRFDETGKLDKWYDEDWNGLTVNHEDIKAGGAYPSTFAGVHTFYAFREGTKLVMILAYSPTAESSYTYKRVITIEGVSATDLMTLYLAGDGASDTRTNVKGYSSHEHSFDAGSYICKTCHQPVNAKLAEYFNDTDALKTTLEAKLPSSGTAMTNDCSNGWNGMYGTDKPTTSEADGVLKMTFEITGGCAVGFGVQVGDRMIKWRIFANGVDAWDDNKGTDVTAYDKATFGSTGSKLTEDTCTGSIEAYAWRVSDTVHLMFTHSSGYTAHLTIHDVSTDAAMTMYLTSNPVKVGNVVGYSSAPVSE